MCKFAGNFKYSKLFALKMLTVFCLSNLVNLMLPTFQMNTDQQQPTGQTKRAASTRQTDHVQHDRGVQGGRQEAAGAPRATEGVEHHQRDAVGTFKELRSTARSLHSALIRGHQKVQSVLLVLLSGIQLPEKLNAQYLASSDLRPVQRQSASLAERALPQHADDR